MAGGFQLIFEEPEFSVGTFENGLIWSFRGEANLRRIQHGLAVHQTLAVKYPKGFSVMTIVSPEVPLTMPADARDLKVSAQMDVMQARVLDMKATPIHLRGRHQVAVVGQKIILSAGVRGLVVSADAGHSFKSYDVPALHRLRPDYMSSVWMICGTSGCDFEVPGEPELKQIWRWGSKPLADTLEASTR